MSAIITPCGLYRVRLEREVQEQGIVVALFGVNPSTADAQKNDSTIRKDMGFARVHGWRKIIKGNVFAYRSKDVKALATVADPLGPGSFDEIGRIIADADLLVPCWGSRDKVPKRLHAYIDSLAYRLRSSGKPVRIFGLTKSGDPMHPLMLGYNTPLVPWL